MNRREFISTVGGAVAASMLAARASAIGAPPEPTHATENATGDSIHSTVPSGPPQQIAMLVYPQFTALDLVGPHAFLSGLMNVEVHLVWKNKDPIATDRGNLTVVPSATLAECPKDLDILSTNPRSPKSKTPCTRWSRSALDYRDRQGMTKPRHPA